MLLLEAKGKQKKKQGLCLATSAGGSKKTLRLYTLDLDHRRVSVKPKLRGQKRKAQGRRAEAESEGAKRQVQNRYKVRQMREAVKSEQLDLQTKYPI